MTPTDFWATFRDAHFVGWGSISWVYSARTDLVTLPGYPVLLAPIAMISSALGLTENSPHYPLVVQHVQAWLIAGPFVMLSAALPLFGIDAFTRRLNVAHSRRIVLIGAVSAAVWPTLAIWGHPEDVMALGFAVFALVAAVDGRWTKAAWLVGAAISMQLLAVLLVPILLGAAGLRRSTPLLLRASVLPGFLAVAVLIPDFHDSWIALTRQPNYPTIDHPTPWVLLSPALGPHAVSAGPVRMVGMAAAAACAVLAWKWRGDWGRLLWLWAAAMAARCIFEAVVDAYYVMPAVVFALAAAATLPLWRWLLVAAAGAGVTVMTFWYANMWIYWTEMTAILVIMLVLALPRPALRNVGHAAESASLVPNVATSVPIEALGVAPPSTVSI